ncbi:hypothetical protein RH915_04050 [Serpentinicella sp. ANB-PHB4]|uniref:hypothetical protein n=1 Tax=Serpentinicella sp. ANB-PHB4 TaxID=3074076 RepID=UPI00285F8990|nr:hypothetical protein [Serpentinicella sp. ANB-PHB4]MDR5658654.1 hypothetical protein [Serpentinicella sp. ANB-PHB4]
MTGLNICIDIDGTLTEPYYWLDYANQYFNKTIGVEEVIQYEIHEVMGVSFEAFIEFYRALGPEMHAKAQIRSNVHEVLWKLNEKHQIYYVTARNENMTDITRRWLEDHKLPKGELYLLGSHHKAEKAKELHCDIFIEDSFENCVELSSAGFEVILLDCNYNQHSLLPGMVRVKGWTEIDKIIDGMIKESGIA